jgi:RNA polymerase sigma-B factor
MPDSRSYRTDPTPVSGARSRPGTFRSVGSTRTTRNREDALAILRQARETDDLHRRQMLQEQVVVAHMGCAHSMAARFRGKGVDYDDLVQVAYLGLVKAAHGCDPDRCVDFLQYATPTIMGELKRHFRDHAWSVRPPRRLQEMQPQVNLARTHLTQELGREPTSSEVADSLEMPTEQVDEAIAAGRGFSTTPFDPLTDSPWHPSGEDPELRAIENLETLSSLFEPLTERERKVVVLRYYVDCTQAEIGARLGISQMQISRTLRSAMDKLAAARDRAESAVA